MSDRLVKVTFWRTYLQNYAFDLHAFLAGYVHSATLIIRLPHLGVEGDDFLVGCSCDVKVVEIICKALPIVIKFGVFRSRVPQNFTQVMAGTRAHGSYVRTGTVPTFRPHLFAFTRPSSKDILLALSTVQTLPRYVRSVMRCSFFHNPTTYASKRITSQQKMEPWSLPSLQLCSQRACKHAVMY